MGEADILLDYFRRYLTADDVATNYHTAAAAILAGNTTVVITASSMPDGGSASGEMRGNPAIVAAVCKRRLEEIEAADAAEPIEPPGGDPITHFDFSRRIIRT